MIDNGTDVTVNSKLIITGTTNIQGNTSITGSLTVASGSATMLGGDLYVSGNLQILGSSTNVSLQSNTVEIGDNIILVNAYSPFQRYAGLSAYDSGSASKSGSLLWDSTSNEWLSVTSTGATINSSKLIGTTEGVLGSTEVSLTQYTFPIASGEHTIQDSILKMSGSHFNVTDGSGRRFTIDTTSGDIITSGSIAFRSDYGVGFDSGSLLAEVTFRDSVSKKMGLVSTTTSSFTVGSMLGYKTSDGTLTFTDTIDGGTF